MAIVRPTGLRIEDPVSMILTSLLRNEHTTPGLDCEEVGRLSDELLEIWLMNDSPRDESNPHDQESRVRNGREQDEEVMLAAAICRARLGYLRLCFFGHDLDQKTPIPQVSGNKPPSTSHENRFLTQADSNVINSAHFTETDRGSYFYRTPFNMPFVTVATSYPNPVVTVLTEPSAELTPPSESSRVLCLIGDRLRTAPRRDDIVLVTGERRELRSVEEDVNALAGVKAVVD